MDKSNNNFDELMDEIISQRNQRITAKIERREAIRKSKDYSEQITKLDLITQDFILALKFSSFFLERCPDFRENSISVLAITDLLETSLMIRMIVKEGFLNPAKRELRYIIELAIKAVYVDQNMWRDPLPEKLKFWKKSVNQASITPEIYKIDFIFFEENNDLVEDVKRCYGRACKYVHPSVHQIKERIDLALQGVTIGLETAKELKEIVDEIFLVYSFVLVFIFHGIGHSTVGELFEGVWNTMPKWSFHWNKYILEIDKYFDYKHERQEKLEIIKLNRQKRLTKLKTKN